MLIRLFTFRPDRPGESADELLRKSILPALETERDRDAWYALVTALGRIGVPEACAALAEVAVTRRNVLLRRGYSTGQRLAAIEALGQAGTDAARGTLERLAQDADGVVRYAADRIVQAHRQRAGER